MRVKTLKQAYLKFEFPSSCIKEVRRYRTKYAALNQLLLEVPELVDLAHADFERFLSASTKGRDSVYTSEEILRVLVVMFVEAEAYRDVVVKIENSDFLRQFVGLGWAKPMMDFAFVCKAIAALSGAAWAKMNETLAQYAHVHKRVSTEALRTDTTVVETAIHYPTDSSLLWDSFRVLSRTLRRVQRSCPRLCLKHRYHVRKVKKLAQFIARNAKSKSKRTQQKVRTAYATLMERVRWVVDVSQHVQGLLGAWCSIEAPELMQFTPLAERVVAQTQRRVFDGEVVPAGEKIHSIFEPHTELIVRGKAGKRVEFGHKVLLSQTREKFIGHWRVLKRAEDDSTLSGEVRAAHEALFGALPATFAADKGFYKDTAQLANMEEKIANVSICKLGRRTAAEAAREYTEAFRAGQRFRAGVEGSISVLKWAFNLSRCLYKGFKHYEAAVGCAVFAHNLIVLLKI